MRVGFLSEDLKEIITMRLYFDDDDDDDDDDNNEDYENKDESRFFK